MAHPDHGGPAFPQQCADALDVGMVHEGMSLLDYFAGQALAGFLARRPPRDVTYAGNAAMAYRQAHAMLDAAKAAREGVS